MSDAIILAQGYRKDLLPLIEEKPSCLFCLLGKPIIFHLLEELYSLGVRKATLVLHHLPHKVEEAVGDGSRFGIEITYLLSHSLKEPCKELFITLADCDKKKTLYFCSGDSFTKVENPPRLFAVGGSFAKVEAEQLLRLSPHFEETEIWDELCRILPTTEGETFSCRSLSSFSDANFSLLKHPEKLYLPPTVKKKGDIFISQEASIHREAKLQGPLFIGSGALIAKGASIGPHVIIEEGCIIDKDSSLQEAIIGENTYVGKGLKVCDSLIIRKDLFHLGLGTHIELHDALLITPLDAFSWKKTFYCGLEKGTAFFFSLLLFSFIRKYEKEGDGAFGWHFIPGHRFKELIVNLPRIAKGEAHFVGLKPRQDKVVSSLSKEHQALIRKEKMGWAHLDYPEDETSSYACDAYYAASHSFLSDLKLFLKKLLF
jgi:hypothetical protein